MTFGGSNAARKVLKQTRFGDLDCAGATAPAVLRRLATSHSPQ
jgi:hypothetical protein